MTTSFIFCNKSSHKRLGLPSLLKVGGSKSALLLLNLVSNCWYMYVKKFTVETLIWIAINCSFSSVALCIFPTSSLTREGMLVFYEESFLPFFFLKLSSSAFIADASATVTFPVALTNSGISAWDFFLFFWLVKYQRKSLFAKIPFQHKVFFFHSTHW